MDGFEIPELTRMRLIAALAALLAVFWVFELSRLLDALRLRWRFRRAARLEAEARAVLASCGFSVMEEQAQRASWVRVDGAPLKFFVRADYLVKDDKGRVFVAEVKSGEQAVNLQCRDTRRQLLEYWRVFDEAQGLLLVDMEGRRVREVGFE